MSETPVIPAELLEGTAPESPCFVKWIGRVYMIQSVEVANAWSPDGYNNEDVRLRVDNVPGYLIREGNEVMFIHHAIMLSLMDDVTTGLKMAMACYHAPKVWTATDPISFGQIGTVQTYPRPSTRMEVARAAFDRLAEIGPNRYASARLNYISKNLDAIPVQFNKLFPMPGWTRRALTALNSNTVDSIPGMS